MEQTNKRDTMEDILDNLDNVVDNSNDATIMKDIAKTIEDIKTEIVPEVKLEDTASTLLIKFKKSLVDNMNQRFVKLAAENPKGHHPKYKLIKLACEQRLNILLVGEAGVGKNHISEQIAKELKIEFYPTQKVSAEHKISGYRDGNGIYHETSFYKAFKDGGIFYLDEMDASDGEALIELNAALANRYYDFPNGRVEAHKDFICLAGANTFGSGATDTYNSRNRLDGATLDRFITIEMDYNTMYEISLGIESKSDECLAYVNFIRTLRKVSRNLVGEGLIFSTRMIQNGIKLLKAGATPQEVVAAVVKKGLDEGILNSIATEMQKYYFATDKMTVNTHSFGILWMVQDFYNSLFEGISKIVPLKKYFKILENNKLDYTKAIAAKDSGAIKFFSQKYLFN